MLEIKNQIDIDAPTDQVWQALAKLDSVQDWVQSVTKSYYATGQTEGVGAARVCEVQGFGTLNEEVIEWDDGKTLTYAVEGMPKIVKHIQNTWRLEPLGDGRTRASTHVKLETRYGAFGAFMGQFMMRPRMNRLMKSGMASFKAHVEQNATAPKPAPQPLHAHVA